MSTPEPQPDFGALARKMDELSSAVAELKAAQTVEQKRDARADVEEAEDAVASVAKARGLSRDEAEQAIEKAKDEADYKRNSTHFERFLTERLGEGWDKDDDDAAADAAAADGSGDGGKDAAVAKPPPPKPKADADPESGPHWTDKKLTDLLR